MRIFLIGNKKVFMCGDFVANEAPLKVFCNKGV